MLSKSVSLQLAVESVCSDWARPTWQLLNLVEPNVRHVCPPKYQIRSLCPGRRDVKVKTRGSKGCFEGAKHIRWDHWCNDVPRVDLFLYGVSHISLSGK